MTYYTEMHQEFVIGVDIGTGSARAGLFDLSGHSRATASEPIRTWRDKPDWAEQSSDDIWRAVCKTVGGVLAMSSVQPDHVAGIGFDATCSLVALDAQDRPLTVSDSGDPTRNVIVWMDHRAIAETEEINAGGHDVLRYVGGRLSPEMQTPKLLWLKRNLPATWSSAGKFLDLADYLVYQSTGRDIRSLCTVVCKWTYLGLEGRWDPDYFQNIGLDDLLAGGRIGNDVRPPGAPAGHLTAEAASSLGLTQATMVGVGIIDAHAGALGLLGASLDNGELAPLALIGGTSSCHMAVSRKPLFVPGVWGPYFGALVPDLWLTEGGQSATGALIDYTLENHTASPALQAAALAEGVSVYHVINRHLETMAHSAGLPYIGLLAADVHVLDYHLGNRSPIADPRARGLIDGLTLDRSRDSLALTYLATVQAVAYGTQAIIDAMNKHGHNIAQIHVVGGGTKNPVWMQEHADALQMALQLPAEPESVLLGAAILGASAARAYPSVIDAMRGMCHTGSSVEPNVAMAGFHAIKYACYRQLYAQQLERRQAMQMVMR
jgi:FGGY-family pentulose kinase